MQRAVRAKQYWSSTSSCGLALQDPAAGEAHRDGLPGAAASRQVPDPALRAKLTPTYRAGCKRLIVADDWYPALTRPNVDVVTDAITRGPARRASSPTDGAVHAVDTLILGTGFEIMPVADPLRGRDGVSLAERWAEHREAYLGTTVAGYPNYFMLVGPEHRDGHTSVLLYAEAQIEYVLQCLRHVERNGARRSRCGPRCSRLHGGDPRQKLQGTVWLLGRLQHLVPQRPRRDVGALARLHVAVREGAQRLRPRGLRAAPNRRRSSCIGSNSGLAPTRR